MSVSSLKNNYKDSWYDPKHTYMISGISNGARIALCAYSVAFTALSLFSEPRNDEERKLQAIYTKNWFSLILGGAIVGGIIGYHQGKEKDNPISKLARNVVRAWNER